VYVVRNISVLLQHLQTITLISVLISQEDIPVCQDRFWKV